MPRLCPVRLHFVASWAEFEAQAPDLAAAIRARFGAHIHSVLEAELVDGDAKLNGRAFEVIDPATIARFMGSLPEPPSPSGVGLFRTELTDASLTRVQGDELVIDSWRAGEPPRHTRRQ
jgi:hypothetical protein